MAADIARHIRIAGRVQGVGYRAWAEDTALALGLKGWVRNRRDGAVEAVFQGPPDRVAQILLLCERGPPAASVTAVEQLGEVPAEHKTFEVRHTA